MRDISGASRQLSPSRERAKATARQRLFLFPVPCSLVLLIPNPLSLIPCTTLKREGKRIPVKRTVTAGGRRVEYTLIQSTRRDVLLQALPQGVDVARACMVGDRRFDIEAAKALGLASIGAGYGYGLPGELADAGADAVYDSVSDLTAALISGSCNQALSPR